jgi:aryl-alcohol dehydrogenase-like predicted oxidoreductase
MNVAEQKRILIPNSDVEISPITYGAFAIGGWFWGGASKSDGIEAIETAIDQGITSIDTAPIYGMGRSEAIVGEAIRHQRGNVQILTKFGMRWDLEKGDFFIDSQDNDGNPVKIYKYNGKESIIEECEASLKRLNTDYIDLYQMHWPESVTPIDEVFEALSELKKSGKIRAAGLCNSNIELLQADSDGILSTNQVAYSMLNRNIENELVPYCVEAEIGILSHTILHKGLLTGKIRPGHQFGEGDHRAKNPMFKPDNHQKIVTFLDSLNPIARKWDCTLSQLVINWTMQQTGITSVLVGARDKQQMKDNAQALNFMLDEADLLIINSLLNDLTLEV